MEPSTMAGEPPEIAFVTDLILSHLARADQINPD
jgi:hypothetical protein